MTMSDDELKAKFAEYELAGKFDYMAAFKINQIVGDTRTKNVLKNLHDFYMFAHLGTDKISQLPYVAPYVMQQLAKELKRHSAFVFRQDHPSLVIEGMPTFEDLLTTGQLDDYLIEGERIASIVNPNWRTECFPDPWRKNEYREQKIFTDMYAQLSDEIRPFTQKDNDKTDARFPNWHQEPGLVPKDAQIITDEGVKMSHATDDASIKEKFTEYEAAGKFAYLSASTIGSMGVSKGLSNFFSIAEIHHVKDLIRFSVSDVAFFHNFGAVKCLELLSLLEKTNGFLYENTGWYSSFKPGMKDSLDDMPTFKDLYISGELDAYLAEGEELADKRNPKWRAELGLPPKKAKFSAGEQNAKEKFIIEHIAKSVNRIGRSFETPLDRVHPLFGGETIKELNGKTNAEGETLDFLGDLVLVGRQKLVENFGVNEEQIAVLDKTLPMYRLNLDMRTEAEAVYAQQTANANQPPASDDAQRQDKKKAYFKTYFTAP